MFETIMNLVGGRKKTAHHAGAAKEAKKQVLRQINTQVHELKLSISDKNTKQKSAEFYALVKKAFRQSLAIKYEATIEEILEEINKKRHYSEKLRGEITSFLEDIAMMEYGYSQFKELLEEKKHEQEQRLITYLHDIEKEGERVDKKTKKQISSIISENVPHSDKEFLLSMLDKFKSILHQVY